MGGISLRPTINALGGYFFVIPMTRQILNRKNFIPLPLPQEVINIVYCLAHRNTRGLEIRYRYRHSFLEAEDRDDDDPGDSTYAPSKEEDRKNGDERYEKDTNINPPPD